MITAEEIILTAYAFDRPRMDWQRQLLFLYQQCHACVLGQQLKNQVVAMVPSLIFSRYDCILHIVTLPIHYILWLTSYVTPLSVKDKYLSNKITIFLSIVQAWEKWRGQIAKLDCSAFWVQCGHRLTREGLRNLLQVMLGNTSSLASATCHWLELCISHFLYVRHFTTVSSYHLNTIL